MTQASFVRKKPPLTLPQERIRHLLRRAQDEDDLDIGPGGGFARRRGATHSEIADARLRWQTPAQICFGRTNFATQIFCGRFIYLPRWRELPP